ncbi:MAG TPA: hypothetical protein VMU55_04105 [Solirubrobacteraceae bacterium]|nr:hypothetical protein [Solirubrobacteraceae bacterium]
MSQLMACRHTTAGERVELSRYTVASGERVIYGQRIKGVVRITDRPANGQGRSYLIDRGLEEDGYDALKALVADYTAQAAKLDDVPMAASVLRRHLERLAGNERARHLRPALRHGILIQEVNLSGR